MDGFIEIFEEIVYRIDRNIIVDRHKGCLALPGYFRPTKLWDILISYKGELLAAIELKSQVGPSFGNNFNNRSEEAIGTALDFWTAYREKAFGGQPAPFLGWLVLVEDTIGSRSAVRCDGSRYQVFPEFIGACYLERYKILCEKLMFERSYTSTALIASPKSAVIDGAFCNISEMTSINSFLQSFSSHIGSSFARLNASW